MIRAFLSAILALPVFAAGTQSSGRGTEDHRIVRGRVTIIVRVRLRRVGCSVRTVFLRRVSRRHGVVRGRRAAHARVVDDIADLRNASLDGEVACDSSEHEENRQNADHD